MEIELSNGKDRLFQWDQGQKVKVPGDIPTVHFKWGNEGVPFDVVDGWVEIAPELTQKPGNIYIWTYNEDHTLDAARIPVEKRPKPAGYAYTPTEIKTWEQLDKRIDALEAANVQPNWDQNDDSAADYVRGRTHYVGSKHDVRIIKQGSGEFTPELGLIVGNSYRVWYDAGSGFGDDAAAKEFVCQTHSTGDGTAPNPFDGKPYVGNAGTDGGPNPYLIFDNFILLHTGFNHVVTITKWKIEGDFADIKTLDSKYLDPTLLKRIQALEDGGGVAGVSSVNGQTGAVTLNADDVGAVSTVNGARGAVKTAFYATATQTGIGVSVSPTPKAIYDAYAAGYSVYVQADYPVMGGLTLTLPLTLALVRAVDAGIRYILAFSTVGALKATAAPMTQVVAFDGESWHMWITEGVRSSDRLANPNQLQLTLNGVLYPYDGTKLVRLPAIDTKSLGITGAAVGQIVKISAVDGNGVPTAWVPVDMATGGGEWDKVYEQTLTEDVDTYSYDLGDVRAAAIVVAPGADVASGWKKLTVNDIQIPISNSAVSNGTGLALLVDLDSVVKVKAWIGLATYQVGTYGTLGRVTGSTVIDGITSINKIGVATGTLLKSGSKIEVYVRER